MKTYSPLLICSVFLAASLVGCSETLAPVATEATFNIPATMIKVEQLAAHNISENMSFLSTQNDEIILLSYLMKKQQDSVTIIEEKIFKNLVFDSTRTIHYLNHTFDPAEEALDNMITTFVLVEMDNDGTEADIQYKFRSELVNGHFLKETEREKLDSMIGDDDFLGLKYLDMKDLSRGEAVEIVFKGIYLFDRFKYTLHCRGL